MGYAYSPFNPIIWLIFIGFCVLTYLIVKLFHRKYPNYPNQPHAGDPMYGEQGAPTQRKPPAAR